MTESEEGSTTIERSPELERTIGVARAVRDRWQFDLDGLFQPGDGVASTAVWNSLAQYVKFGGPLGHFLDAVVTNDLAEAVGRADETNRQALPGLVMFLYNRVPSDCWRTPEKVARWREAHAILNSEEPELPTTGAIDSLS
jgi:hypothetical protein